LQLYLATIFVDEVVDEFLTFQLGALFGGVVFFAFCF
jgi:hypothetical protein